VLSRYLNTLLFGVGTWDPLTLAASTAVLMVASAVACYVPARRALRVDPVSALRAE
jgi:putative ABC transport system permease protein